MSNALVHDMNTAWVSSAPALAVSVDPLAPPGAAGSSNHFVAAAGALNAVVSLTPPAPLDLRGFDEIRFWIRADRAADQIAHRDAVQCTTGQQACVVAEALLRRLVSDDCVELPFWLDELEQTLALAFD